MLLLAMMLHQQALNLGLNSSDTEPNARMRPAHAHRAYILDKVDFVEVYSRRGPSHGMGAWDAAYGMFREGGVTRCATSQYAVTTYLCGKTIADTDGQGRLGGIGGPADLRQYVRDLDSIVQDGDNDTCTLWPELVLRFNLGEETDPAVDHTFVLHFLPEGGVQVYQSFITHYTLRSYLSSHGPLDAAGLDAFIDNMQVVTNATAWGPREDAAYKANFLVSLRATGFKVEVGARGIGVLVEPACLVVPWESPALEDYPDYEDEEWEGVLLPLVAGTALPPQEE